MKQILIITTGGTIAMRADAQAGGAVPALGAADLAAAVPAKVANVRTFEFSNVPSAQLTVEQIWQLACRVGQMAEQADIDGIVVTHGTDTLEESAYLCDVTISSVKPVVFTGAMRTASEIGYDGLANLTASLRVAASDDARGLGTLVVMNDQIHTARDVTKTNTTAVDTFKSPLLGPIGYVDYDGVVLARRPAPRVVLDATRLEPRVFLLKLGIGMGTELLELAVQAGCRGLVIEGLGGGRVPPAWIPVLGRTIEGGVPVVIAARVGSGRTVDRYAYAGAHRDLVQAGCWFTEGLNGQKARVRLMAALGTSDPARYFGHV